MYKMNNICYYDLNCCITFDYFWLKISHLNFEVAIYDMQTQR